MVKELIRNGGFELEDISFWENIDAKSFEAINTDKKYGLWCGKSVQDAAGFGQIRVKDFIAVNEGEILGLDVWLKASNEQTTYILLYTYDSDLSAQDYIFMAAPTVPTSWKQYTEYVSIPKGVSYIKPCFYFTGATEDHYFLIDSLSVYKLDIDTLFLKPEELIAVVDETTKHTVNGDEFFSGIWKHAEYFLDVTSFTETGAVNPVTLDVKIETYDPKTEKWRDAMVFQQLSCAASGSETTQEYKSLSSNLGWKQRVTYTTAGAGTIGDCDFKVGVVYKR